MSNWAFSGPPIGVTNSNKSSLIDLDHGNLKIGYQTWNGDKMLSREHSAVSALRKFKTVFRYTNVNLRCSTRSIKFYIDFILLYGVEIWTPKNDYKEED